MHEDYIDEHKTSKFKINYKVKNVNCKCNNVKTSKIKFIINVCVIMDSIKTSL